MNERLSKHILDAFHGSGPRYQPVTLKAETFIELGQLAEEVWAMEKRMGEIHQKLRLDGHAFSMSSAYNAGEALHALGQQLDEGRFDGLTPMFRPNTGEAWRP